MMYQGLNANDFQRNQLLAQQMLMQTQLQQFTPKSVRRNMYSVIEVQSDDEIRGFRLEQGITYVFLNENSDRIYIRQLDERREPVTYAYRLSLERDDELSDPVSKLERRLENLEKLIGGKSNVQSEINEKSFEEFDRKSGSKKIERMAEAKSGIVPEGSLFDTREVS